MGLPVPAGFTITTDACRAYMAAGGLPDGLDGRGRRARRRLEEKTGKRFGDPDDPLLVSVRSGAAISMPGMMDTILNLGLGDAAAEGLAARTGNRRFALDSYRRLIQMFGEVVEGIDGHRFEDALDALKRERGVALDTDLTADDLDALIETYRGIYREAKGEEFPQDASEQLRRAVRAVFDSWDTPRARVYRKANEIPDDIGTAVNVVQMVFGNKGDRSGTGVAFTRDPSTGESAVMGEFLANAQGEDVVAGIRTPQPVAAMGDVLPGAYEQLLETLQPARAALPRRAGRRVHGRGRPALPAADARREAHRARGARDRGLDGRRGADLARGGAGAHRPRPARPAPASDDRPGARARGGGARPEREPGRGQRRRRLRRRHRGRAREGRPGDPRPHGDDAGRHPRDDRGRGDPHRARRHDLARGRRRARHGQAVRRGLRRARRSTTASRASAGQELHEGDQITIDGGTGPGLPRRGAARRAGAERGLRDDPRLGRRRAAPARCARTPTRPRTPPARASSAPRASASAAPSTCSSATSGCRSSRR